MRQTLPLDLPCTFCLQAELNYNVTKELKAKVPQLESRQVVGD